MANTNYGKIVDGQIVYAPNSIGNDFNLTAEKYAEAGFLPVVNESPATPDGKIPIRTGWEVRDGAIYPTYEYVDKPAGALDDVALGDEPTQRETTEVLRRVLEHLKYSVLLFALFAPCVLLSDSSTDVKWADVSPDTQVKTIVEQLAPVQPEDVLAVQDSTDALAKESARIVQLLQGEDFRVTITNYDSTVNVPTASFDARYSDGSTSSWHTVWTETNGLERVKNEVLGQVASNTYTKAESDERYTKWGKYDSTTGEQAPDGFVQVSSDNGMIIASGQGYANYVAPSGGSYWIWRGNGKVSMNDSGTLDILDHDGNSVFSVVKGDKQLVGADASSIQVVADGDTDAITLVYNVESNESPIVEYTPSLSPTAWVQCGTDGAPSISWTHDSDANKWTGRIVVPSSIRSGYFRGAYMKGSETYLKTENPMSISKLILGGVTYRLGTAVINGNTVLTLTAE